MPARHCVLAGGPKIFYYLFGLANEVLYIEKKKLVMEDIISRCPKCYSCELVKNGMVKGMQRYCCKICDYRSTVPKLGKRPEQNFVLLALILHLQGMSCRNIERFLGVGHVTVMNWVKKYFNRLDYLENIPNGSNLVKVDKLCSYKGKNKTTYESGLLLPGAGSTNLVIIRESENSPPPPNKSKNK